MQNFRVLLLVLMTFALPAKLAAMGQEDFGDKPISEANYTDFQGIMSLLNQPGRVYHSWVNGNEHFYYKGNTTALNEALKAYTQLKAEPREVFLRPGPGVTNSFMRDRQTAFNWNVHIVGGIARHMATLDKGDKVWSRSPLVTVCVGDGIDLNEIKLPAGVTVLELSDLTARCREGLTSKDKTVRGWTCGVLAQLDPYDDDSVAAVVKMLKDPDDWVRLNAAGAVSIFGNKAQSALPALREALGSADEQLKKRLEESIRSIERAPEKRDAEAMHKSAQKAIHQFKENLPGSNG